MLIKIMILVLLQFYVPSPATDISYITNTLLFNQQQQKAAYPKFGHNLDGKWAVETSPGKFLGSFREKHVENTWPDDRYSPGFPYYSDTTLNMFRGNEHQFPDRESAVQCYNRYLSARSNSYSRFMRMKAYADSIYQREHTYYP